MTTAIDPYPFRAFISGRADAIVHVKFFGATEWVTRRAEELITIPKIRTRFDPERLPQ